MNHGQSHLHSWLEAGANTVIGFAIGMASNEVVLPLFGMHVALWANFEMSLIFMVISVARSFALRRCFNALHLVQFGPRK